MAMLKVGAENTTPIEIYYEDHGSGMPVVLVHGWPLNGASWEKQTIALLKAGFRVITYDRRGFGKSSQPATGYDYDTMASDLHKLIEHLDIRGAALFGFSMGGGEVARYFGKYGTSRFVKCGFFAAVTPALRKTGDNPDGVPDTVFAEVKAHLYDDRAHFLKGFLKDFYGAGVITGTSVTDEAMHWSWVLGMEASLIGAIATVDAWGTDLREDLRKIDIPTLVLHGDDDKTVPFEHSGKRMPEFLKHCELKVIGGAPHGFLLTHAEEANVALVDFLKS